MSHCVVVHRIECNSGRAAHLQQQRDDVRCSFCALESRTFAWSSHLRFQRMRDEKSCQNSVLEIYLLQSFCRLPKPYNDWYDWNQCQDEECEKWWERTDSGILDYVKETIFYDMEWSSVVSLGTDIDWRACMQKGIGDYHWCREYGSCATTAFTSSVRWSCSEHQLQ